MPHPLSATAPPHQPHPYNLGIPFIYFHEKSQGPSLKINQLMDILVSELYYTPTPPPSATPSPPSATPSPGLKHLYYEGKNYIYFHEKSQVPSLKNDQVMGILVIKLWTTPP